MRRRLSLLLAVLVTAVAVVAPAARAQVSDPFGVSTPTPVPTAASPSSQDDTSDSVLYVIAAGVLVIFLGIGWFITRDARGRLTAEDRRAVERGEFTRLEDDRVEGAVGGKRKQRARKKGKAQRRARKANRPR